MAAKKPAIYISAELDWAEQKLLEWKAYVDANPLITLKDRIDLKETARGGVIRTVVANIEAQVKSIRDTMKEYLVLLDTVNKMRQADEADKEKIAKGNATVPFRMRTKPDEG